MLSFPFRRLAALALIAAGALGTDPAPAAVPVKFTLDWKFQGPTAAFLVAVEKGYYAAEGLDVTIDSGSGSAGAVTRVASGAYQMGFADLNAMINFRVQNPGQDVKGVMVVYDAPPFALFTLPGRGIETPADLVGKKLGAPVFDASYQLFPAFAKQVGIDPAAVIRVNMDPPLREVMLIRGDVDFISGHYFTSLLDLKSKGVPGADIKIFLYRDFGLDFYGNGIIASAAFLKDQPAAVRGFLKATLRAWRDVIANPEASLAAVVARDPLVDKGLELERLNLALAVNILTPYVKENGLGDVDPARLANSIAQLGIAYKFAALPAAADVWSSDFLPAKEDRMVAP